MFVAFQSTCCAAQYTGSIRASFRSERNPGRGYDICVLHNGRGRARENDGWRWWWRAATACGGIRSILPTLERGSKRRTVRGCPTTTARGAPRVRAGWGRGAYRGGRAGSVGERRISPRVSWPKAYPWPPACQRANIYWLPGHAWVKPWKSLFGDPSGVACAQRWAVRTGFRGRVVVVVGVMVVAVERIESISLIICVCVFVRVSLREPKGRDFTPKRIHGLKPYSG
jgi:hypothetical protein